MDLKALVTTLAVLGSGSALVACDKGAPKGEDADKADKAHTADKAEKADAAESDDAKEVEAAAGETEGDKGKGEGSCAPGGCAPGACGGNADDKTEKASAADDGAEAEDES